MSEKLQSVKDKLLNRYFESVDDEDDVLNIEEDTTSEINKEENISLETKINEEEAIFILDPMPEEKPAPVIEEKAEPKVRSSLFSPKPTTSPSNTPIKKASQISKATKIDGSINGDCNLEIFGQINGDINTTGSIVIDGGRIVGNVKAFSVTIIKSEIIGNIECQDFVDAQEYSEIKGHINSKNASINSVCEGNINVEKTLHILESADILGDVQAEKLRTEEGALIEGQMRIKKPQQKSESIKTEDI